MFFHSLLFFICVLFHAWVPFPSSFDDSLFFLLNRIHFLFLHSCAGCVLCCWVTEMPLFSNCAAGFHSKIFGLSWNGGMRDKRGGNTQPHEKFTIVDNVRGKELNFNSKIILSLFFFLILKNTLEEEFCMFALYFARVLASSSSYRIHKVAFWHFMKRDYRTLVSKKFLVRLFSLSSTLKVNCKEEEREKFQNIQHLLICCPQQFLNSRKIRAEKTDNEQN